MLSRTMCKGEGGLLHQMCGHGEHEGYGSVSHLTRVWASHAQQSHRSSTVIRRLRKRRRHAPA